MAEDLLKKTEKAVTKSEHLVAAQYSYLDKAKKNLEDAKKDSTNGDFKAADNRLGDAKRNLRWVGRGEYRADRAEHEVLDDLQKLAEELPAEMKQDLERIEKRLLVEVETLEKNTSMYTGKMKDMVDEAKTLVQVSIKENGKGADFAIKKIDEVIEFVDTMIKWMAGLITDLKAAENFEAKLEAWIKG